MEIEEDERRKLKEVLYLLEYIYISFRSPRLDNIILIKLP